LTVSEFGDYLGVQGLDFISKNDKGELHNRVPIYQAKQILLTPKGCVSTRALLFAAVYGINTLVLSHSGKPLSVLVPLSQLANGELKLKQFEFCRSPRGSEMAKKIVEAKLLSQKAFLDSLYGAKQRIEYHAEALEKPVRLLRAVDPRDSRSARKQLLSVESSYGEFYFQSLRPFFNRKLATGARIGRGAYDPMNNMLNLGYAVLESEVLKAILSAMLDPSMGVLHTSHSSKFSLALDLMEPHRTIVDKFVLRFSERLGLRDFQLRFGRFFLTQDLTIEFLSQLDREFDSFLEGGKVRGRSQRFRVRTAIQDEAVKFARVVEGKDQEYEPITISL
jgi:CRISPR-associated protein Cas1